MSWPFLPIPQKGHIGTALTVKYEVRAYSHPMPSGYDSLD
jgi:hypothetical protein